MPSTARGHGCTNTAERLGKDKSTVSRQMKTLYSRLGVTNAGDAVARARHLGPIK